MGSRLRLRTALGASSDTSMNISKGLTGSAQIRWEDNEDLCIKGH